MTGLPPGRFRRDPLCLRLHELGRPAFEQLGKEAGPSGWAAVLRGLVDTMLANHKLFVLHERNQTALQALHIKGHDGDHEEMEQQFRRILGDPAIPARDPVRLSCSSHGATLAGPIAPTEDEARRCELGRGRNSFGAQTTAGRCTGAGSTPADISQALERISGNRAGRLATSTAPRVPS